VVITHCGRENVATAIERSRKRFATQKFTAARSTLGATASIGIAGLRATAGPDFSDLLTRADAALYSAKDQGRNRIECEIEKALPLTSEG